MRNQFDIVPVGTSAAGAAPQGVAGASAGRTYAVIVMYRAVRLGVT